MLFASGNKSPRLRCNICGGEAFKEMNGRKNAECSSCASFERTRLMKLHLDRLGLPKPEMRILHLAPEAGLARYLAKCPGYEAGDLDPSVYPDFPNMRAFDVVRDAPSLPTAHYDLILHNHVLEHIEGNITAVLYHLHRALKPDGMHMFSIPFQGDFYEESFATLSHAERQARFGQWDHVRNFAARDLPRTLGMIFRLPANVNLEADFSAAELDTAGIPRDSWKLYSGHFVFVLRKDDLLLRER